MASLPSHFTTFLFLFPVGIRRLLSSSSLFLKNPSLYQSKPWYFAEPRWKNFDLYALLIALPIACFSNLFFFLTFSGNPTSKFSFLQQSAIILLFWVFLILVVLRENIDNLIVHEGFVFIFAGIVFLIEYSLTVKGIQGLIGGVNGLLDWLNLACAGCCLFLSIRPWAFFADFLLSSGILLKGTWMLQVGLNLYATRFSFLGCRMILPTENNVNVKCDLEEDSVRGVALMNLLFIVHVTGILVLSFLLFAALSWNRNMRRANSGTLLAMLQSESMLMQPLPELELE
ncbi:Protein of unknown function DUF716 [Dillenia turbinata]|uniref:Transmembrane protein n=1 Tax=Dillenia turbinata TaxID=194707 RepID=A0AAN8UPA6_9MAGN